MKFPGGAFRSAASLPPALQEFRLLQSPGSPMPRGQLPDAREARSSMATDVGGKATSAPRVRSKAGARLEPYAL